MLETFSASLLSKQPFSTGLRRSDSHLRCGGAV